MHFFQKRLIAFYVLLFCVPLHQIHAQKITSNTEALQQIAQRENLRFEREKAEAISEAEKNGWPVSFTANDSTEYELIRIENGSPVYYQTSNITAAASTSTNHVWPGGRAGLQLDGSGMVMREWDGGGVRTTHQEFGSRVVQVDNPSGLSNHATHVAGTMMAAGVVNDAKGMAYAADLRAFDWNNDNSEMASEAALGALVSQHSYGQIAGWAFGTWSGNQDWHWWGSPSISQNEDWNFGFYNSKTSTWDEIAENAPYYLIVKSAGNDRGAGPGPGTFHYVWNNGWQSSTTTREVAGGSDGYDCIPTYGTAKNILTVGAVFDVPNGYNDPSDVTMTSFSSWGPTDDGRIKPDVVGNGVGVFSSYAGSNTQYASISGTSMSGPNVAGSLLLLQQLHDSLYNGYMRSASLRGLAIHTADESGPNAGPDYMFGWGLLNTEKAAEVLIDTVHSILLEETLLQGDTFRFTVESNGLDSIRVTLCWTDPSAPANTPSLNPSNIKLINDLDIRIQSQSNANINEMPWILNPAIPSAAATRGDNIRDNVEVIPAGVLPAGIYEIVVTHKGVLQQPSSASVLGQDFTIIASGISVNPCAIDPVGVDIVQTDSIFCFGDSSAVLMANISGGTPPFSVTWNDDTTLNGLSLQNTIAGTYTVEVIDGLGCISVDTFNVVQPSELSANAYVDQNVSCYGGNDGQAYVDVSGGTPPYSLSWNTNPAQSSDTIRNLSAGNYEVTVTDANNCETSVSISVSQPADSLSVGVLSVNDVTCFGGDDGNATVTVIGGIPPYSYQWSTMPVQTSDSAFGLVAGTYTVTVTDSNNCTANASLSVNQPSDSIAVSVVNQQNVSCRNGADGFVVVDAQGGHPPYTFEWNNNPMLNTDSVGGLSAGTYQVTVTDSLQCSTTLNVTVTQPNRLNASVISKSNVSCYGVADGVIDVNVSGGTPPFTYNWSHGASSSTAIGLSGGTYTVVITDANGCSDTLTSTITEPNTYPIGPVIGSSFTGPMEVESYSVALQSSATYDWSVQGGSIISGQGTNAIDIEWAQLGVHQLSVTAASADTCDRSRLNVTVSPSFNTHESWLSKVQVYPNPTQGILTVVLPDPAFAEMIELFDAAGKRVFVSTDISEEQQLDLTFLAPGAYTLRIGMYNQRIILVK